MCVVDFPPQGLNLKVLVVDLKERRVLEPVFIRAEQGWEVAELKTEISEVCVGVGGSVVLVWLHIIIFSFSKRLLKIEILVLVSQLK